MVLDQKSFHNIGRNNQKMIGWGLRWLGYYWDLKLPSEDQIRAIWISRDNNDYMVQMYQWIETVYFHVCSRTAGDICNALAHVGKILQEDSFVIVNLHSEEVITHTTDKSKSVSK